MHSLAHHPPALSARAQSRAVDRVLGYASYVRLLAHRRRELALTFDDGPSSYTPAILHVLSSPCALYREARRKVALG
jgi:peptidoglycan/xylan/chitin deacetylase (PgdA/CDA1 family)